MYLPHAQLRFHVWILTLLFVLFGLSDLQHLYQVFKVSNILASNITMITEKTFIVIMHIRCSKILSIYVIAMQNVYFYEKIQYPFLFFKGHTFYNQNFLFLKTIDLGKVSFQLQQFYTYNFSFTCHPLLFCILLSQINLPPLTPVWSGMYHQAYHHQIFYPVQATNSQTPEKKNALVI